MFSIPTSKQTTFIYSPEIYKNLIRQGIKTVMDEIEKVDPELYEELGGEKSAKKKVKDYKFSTEEKKV